MSELEVESKASESETGLEPVSVEVAPLRQKIVAALRRAIELGKMRPGDRLNEKDLCAKLNVSRTSLREALRDLEANGVVSTHAGRGLVITPVSSEDVVSMWRVRCAVEMVLAEDFVERAGPEDYAELGAALERMRAAESSSVGTMDAQRGFYEAWCNGARNSYAFGLLMNIQLRVSVVRIALASHPEFRRQNIEGKTAIFECMSRGDVSAAQEAVRRHIRNAIAAAVQMTSHLGDSHDLAALQPSGEQ